MAIRTSLSDLLDSRLSDTSHSTLDHLVSRDHQNKIALSITDWRSIAPFLGLEETDEEDIEVMYSTVKTRNIAMLRKWKHLHGSSATYWKLLGAFWDVGRVDLIDKLLEMLPADTPPSPSKDKVQTKDNETMIYIKTLSGQCIVLEVIATDTVEDVKTMLQQKLPVEESVESKKLRLIFQGQELSDERLLCEYGIQNHSTVYQRLQTGTIKLCISLPDLGKYLPLTVKPATTFTDIVHRVVALERTLLPYQHLLVTLRGCSSVKLPAGKYVSVVGEYDLKSEDTVELAACKYYCHNLQVMLPSYRNRLFSTLLSLLQSEPDTITLKLHSHDTFKTAETLILKEQRAQIDHATFYSSEAVMLKREQIVGFINKCSVVFDVMAHPTSLVVQRYSSYQGYVQLEDTRSILKDEVPPVFLMERKLGRKKVAKLRPSGSIVVYIHQKSTPLYLPDNDISIFVIKELMRELSPYNDSEVKLFQNDVELADGSTLSECTSSRIEYSGSAILTYHLTAEYCEKCTVYSYQQVKWYYPAICNVHFFSNDTVGDLKTVIEESSGIPLQNQALYDLDYKLGISKRKLKLHDHQAAQDFVRLGHCAYRTVYLDVRLLVIIKTPAGVTIPFEVLSCNDVLSLKRMITIETNIPVEDQTLLSDDTVLENTKSVGTYVGDKKMTIHFTLVVSSKTL